jgi:hypothetical protein
MSSPPEAHQLSAITSLDGARQPNSVVVADWRARLWAKMRDAVRRQRSRSSAAQTPTVAAPLDFATAMRRVEDEVYNAV